MWKLFQSVLKTFRTQAVIPCNRISTVPQDSASLNNKPDDDDDFLSEICSGGHVHRLKPSLDECPCQIFPNFPQISPPSSFNAAFSQKNAFDNAVYSIKLPIPPPQTSKFRPPRTKAAITTTSNISSKKPSLASLHDCMGLAALKSSNKELALQHLLIAADVFGSSKAQYNLGVLYQFHLNDHKEAARRYRLAGNHPDALFNLAYLTLQGPDSDTLLPKVVREKEAIGLLQEAASLGSKEAQKFLVLLGLRDEVADVKKADADVDALGADVSMPHSMQVVSR